MNKQEMWEIINKENQAREENERNIKKATDAIAKLEAYIDEAIKAKNSAKAIKLTDQLENEKKHLEIYRNLAITFSNSGANISKDDFMKCYNKEFSDPYYKRCEELINNLMEQREAYIKSMRDAYKELDELSNGSREFWDIISAGSLDINLHGVYPRDAFRECFIEETRYFFE